MEDTLSWTRSGRKREHINVAVKKPKRNTSKAHNTWIIIRNYPCEQVPNVIFVSDISGKVRVSNVVKLETVDNSNAGSELETNDLEVEKIIDKRMRKNKVEYFLKWKGYNDNDNSWEPKENLNCDELIKKFEKDVIRSKMEKNRKKIGQGSKRSVSNSTSSTALSKRDKLYEPIVKVHNLKLDCKGIQKNELEPNRIHIEPASDNIDNDQVQMFKDEYGTLEKIMNVSKNSSGQFEFLVKFKDISEAKWIPALTANIVWTQMVISYYESLIVFQE